MSIVVTPIPRLIDLAAPAFTLGTANAAGSAATAVASDSTLLAFDTTDPAAVAASAVVGSATTAPRRDHVHPGVSGAGTVVDEAITRFNGTGGDSLQGYSSLSPTISDAGIISLTSGALKFPATPINSADADTLDTYEEGTFTPTLTFGGNAAGVSYNGQLGRYIKVGKLVWIHIRLGLSDKGSSTGNLKYLGLPFTSKNVTSYQSPLSIGYSEYLTFNDIPAYSIPENNTTIDCLESVSGNIAAFLTNADYADNTFVRLAGCYEANA
jgi:hypothetical protein